jgi:hypothetical protein
LEKYALVPYSRKRKVEKTNKPGYFTGDIQNDSESRRLRASIFIAKIAALGSLVRVNGRSFKLVKNFKEAS